MAIEIYADLAQRSPEAIRETVNLANLAWFFRSTVSIKPTGAGDSAYLSLAERTWGEATKAFPDNPDLRDEYLRDVATQLTEQSARLEAEFGDQSMPGPNVS